MPICPGIYITRMCHRSRQLDFLDVSLLILMFSMLITSIPPHQKLLWSSIHQWRKKTQWNTSVTQQKDLCQIPSLAAVSSTLAHEKNRSNKIPPGRVTEFAPKPKLAHTDDCQELSAQCFCPLRGVQRKAPGWRLPLNSPHTYSGLTFILDVFSHFG